MLGGTQSHPASLHLPCQAGLLPNPTQTAPPVINYRFFWGCLNSWHLEETRAAYKRVLCSCKHFWGLSSCLTPICFAVPALDQTQGKQLLLCAVLVAGEVRCDLISPLCGSAGLLGDRKAAVGAWRSLHVQAGSAGMASWLGSFPPFCCCSMMIFPKKALFSE